MRCIDLDLDSPGAFLGCFWVHLLFLGPKPPLKCPRRAKIGINASHVVELIGFGPKKTYLNRFVPRCVPFTRNQPIVELYLTSFDSVSGGAFDKTLRLIT